MRTESQFWFESDRADPVVNALAKRHYTCQSPNSDQFMPPGACIVLRTLDGKAAFGVSMQLPEYVKHAWVGAWNNSIFRNETLHLSSRLILEAVAVVRHLAAVEYFVQPPALGLITFIDRKKVKPKKDWGYCYRYAGFKPAHCPIHEGNSHRTRGCLSCRHLTKDGKFVLQLLPADMPARLLPLRLQNALFEAV